MTKNKQKISLPSNQINLILANTIGFVFSILLVLDGLSFSILFLYIIFPIISLYYYRNIFKRRQYSRAFVGMIYMNALLMMGVFCLRFSGALLNFLNVNCIGIAGEPAECTVVDVLISMEIATLLLIPLVVVNTVYLLKR